MGVDQGVDRGVDRGVGQRAAPAATAPNDMYHEIQHLTRLLALLGAWPVWPSRKGSGSTRVRF